jgi:hypothetical protein
MLALVSFATAVQADGPPGAPIVVTLFGRERVSVVVAQGSVMPCDSTENRSLYRGYVEPGHPLALRSANACVCVEQSYAPLTESDWGPSRMVCQQPICDIWHVCRAAVDPTIRVSLTSRR